VQVIKEHALVVAEAILVDIEHTQRSGTREDVIRNLAAHLLMTSLHDPENERTLHALLRGEERFRKQALREMRAIRRGLVPKKARKRGANPARKARR
jgi:hypothetical protein